MTSTSTFSSTPTQTRDVPPPSRWRRVPRHVRRPLVVTVGVALILTGCVLVVLPGPFTIPPILLGLAVLGTEFAWAHRLRVAMTDRARRAAAGIRRR